MAFKVPWCCTDRVELLNYFCPENVPTFRRGHIFILAEILAQIKT